MSRSRCVIGIKYSGLNCGRDLGCELMILSQAAICSVLLFGSACFCEIILTTLCRSTAFSLVTDIAVI